MKNTVFVAIQYIVPHHLISRTVGTIAASKITWIKNPLITWFIKKYQVNMEEAKVNDVESFSCFNDFFTRELLEDARELNTEKNSLMCPVDGAISQLGAIEEGRIFQAKGQSFTATELLGGHEPLAEPFKNGQFTTIYLSPKDYHRIHMPCDGELTDMIFVPGRLFSVNPATAERVPRLFARNERLVCLFNTEHGRMAMVLVGAMIVASIETVWAGEVAPMKRKVVHSAYTNSNKENITLKIAEEMGRFKLGSTVVLLTENKDLVWSEALSASLSVRLGQTLGVFSDA